MDYDVVVVGTGIAGTCAALAAHEQGARVLVLDKVGRDRAGGSTRLSAGGFRAPTEGYTADDQYDDVMRVTGGRADKAITRYVADNALSGIRWLETMGMEWVDSAKAGRPGLTGRRVQPWRSKPVPIELDGKKQLGFGNGAIQMLHKTLLERVDVRFNSRVQQLRFDDQRRACGVQVFSADEGKVEDVSAGAVVLACGGWQANVAWRVRYFGPAASEWVVRGSRYSTGEGVQMALDAGAAPAGQWGGPHTPIVDARSAPFECGETNVNQYHYTIMLNNLGQRFVDEGADFGDRTIIRYGRSVLAQPGGVAYLIYDSQVAHLIGGNTAEFEAITAGSLEELCGALGLSFADAQPTIRAYNAAVQDGSFDANTLDGKHTSGLQLPKSNWAMTIDRPPFYGYKVTGGLTFGFGGIRVDIGSRVIDTEDRVIGGLYAAGEMVGGLFYDAYPGGSSLTYGTVMGRSAGANAADFAKQALLVATS
jgi:tricarballylate dehydrogenase